MTNIDYPVTYTCKFKETLGEERSENYHCIDRAAALKQAKDDFKKHPFIDCIEFYDDELKMSFTPDDSVHSSGIMSVMFSDNYGWGEHIDDFFDVPIGQIDHADKQTCIDCYNEIAPIIKKYYGTFNVLDQQFLFWSQMYQEETEKEIEND